LDFCVILGEGYPKMPKIKVKHDKTIHQLEIDPSEGLETIKAVIMSLTMVPADRQKLIVKGKEVKEGDDLKAIFKPGAAVLLQGSAEATSAEAVPKDLMCEFSRESPEAPPGFVTKDDSGADGNFTVLTEVAEGTPAATAGLKKFIGRPLRRVNGEIVSSAAEVMKALLGKSALTLQFDQKWAGGGKDDVVAETPPGLSNLGNTCYLNASVQALKIVKPIRDMVATRDAPQGPGILSQIQPDAGDDVGDQAVIGCLKGVFDSMAKSEDGSEITPQLFVAAIKQRFPAFARRTDGGAPMQQDAEEFMSSMLQTLCRGMKGELDPHIEGESQVTLKCVESEGETDIKTEKWRFLLSTVDGDTSTIELGFEARLKQQIDGKMSQTLGRPSIWQGNAEITKLPGYLFVQMARFTYRRDTQNKAKKLRKVQFPFKLDLYRFCTKELQKQLDTRRTELSEERDKLIEKKKQEKMKHKDAKPEEPPAAAGGDAMDVDDAAPEKPPEKTGNDSAFYELAAVVSHAGRTADSGHYKGWVKHMGDWWCFDDEKVHKVTEDKIRELYGGGESDSAYLLLYRSRDETGKEAGLW